MLLLEGYIFIDPSTYSRMDDPHVTHGAPAIEREVRQAGESAPPWWRGVWRAPGGGIIVCAREKFPGGIRA